MDLIEMFAGDVGIMISALFVFAGIADMMVLILFFSKQSPSARASDASTMSEQELKLVKLRLRRYQITQFCIAMSGLFMIAAGLYGISTHLV